MRFHRLAMLASTVALLGAGDLSAQTLRTASEPAEFPPSSYQGRQYVDSAGCVYVRAGVAGNVTWVPRVTRGRDQLCGFQPSLAPSVQAAAPAPAQPVVQAAPRPQPTAPAQAAPVPRATAAAPASAPTPRVIRQPAPVATAQPLRRVTAVQAPAPQPVVAGAPLNALRPEADPRPIAITTPAAAQSPSRAIRVTQPDPARSACANLTGVSAAYTVQHKGSPVRCGPQGSPHVTYSNRSTSNRTLVAAAPRPGTPATPETVPAYTRVAPARVYASQQASLAGVSVPQGMQPVWEDDRLNPYRAHQTFEGREQMLVMWTNTVPQRLIDRRTGADAIHQYPGLQPPYTSFEAQRAAGVTVATQGRYVPAPMTRQQLAELPTQPTPRATVSTRSTPATERQSTPSHRYAQAGLFADPAQAQAAAQRIARSGLPARRGTLARDGRALTLVLAGPFNTQSQLDAGANRLRAMGFANVTLRK